MTPARFFPDEEAETRDADGWVPPWENGADDRLVISERGTTFDVARAFIGQVRHVGDKPRSLMGQLALRFARALVAIERDGYRP